MLKNYIHYLKDNPKGYWFKRKIFGWGWVPVKWQGVAVVFGFIVIVFADSFFILGDDPNNLDLFFFFSTLILAIILLITICYRTGEAPAWQWGLPKKQSPK